MSRIHAKRQTDQRRLARIAEAEQDRRMAELAETPDGQKLLALVRRLGATRLEDWPGVLATASWLPWQPAEYRWAATRMLGEVHDRLMRERGLDPLQDPLPDEPPGLWQQARMQLNATPEPKPEQPKRTKPMLTITINGPEDVAVVRSTLAALAGLVSGDQAVAARTLVAAQSEPDEPPKRRGRAKTAETAAVEPATTEPSEFAPVVEVAPPETAAVDPAPAAPVTEAVVEPVAPTSDDVMKALQGYAKSAGPAALKALLTRFGVNRASELKAEDFARVLEATANG